jgi:ABC-type transport system substrate-binding protein
VELKALLSLSRRSMAKQYADAAYSLLSPAGAAAPGFYAGTRGAASGRADLFRLTRFDAQSTCPIGDLAHHWQVSPDGLRWQFYIRSTLFWHNGDPIKPHSCGSGS